MATVNSLDFVGFGAPCAPKKSPWRGETDHCPFSSSSPVLVAATFSFPPFPHALAHRPDAVVGDERAGIGEAGRDAGGGDGFALLDAGRDGEIQFEKLGEEVFAGGESVSGQDGSGFLPGSSSVR